MLFGKKDKIKCARCSSGIDEKFSFCPYCGLSQIDAEKEMREFGMLGRNDAAPGNFSSPEMNLADQLIGSIMNNLVKTLDKQFKEMEKSDGGDRTEIRALPNGIRIKIGGAPIQQVPKKNPSQVTKKTITEDQIKKMASLPRAEARSNMRRLSDRVVYELDAAGIESPKDVFISKLENGYEIKAIGKKKVFVNTIPVNLQIHGFSINGDTLFVEFLTQEQ